MNKYGILVMLALGLLIYAIALGRKFTFTMPPIFRPGERLSIRVIRIAAGTTALFMVAIFFYFIFRFPDGPLHECSSHGYCGKQGQPHSLSDFRSFIWWQTLLFWSWPPGILVLGLLQQRIPKSPDAIPENVKKQIQSLAAPDYDKIRETYRSDR
jgi:hypothetical protein